MNDQENNAAPAAPAPTEGFSAAVHQVRGALELCEPEDLAAFDFIIAAITPTPAPAAQANSLDVECPYCFAKLTARMTSYGPAVAVRESPAPAAQATEQINCIRKLFDGGSFDLTDSPKSFMENVIRVVGQQSATPVVDPAELRAHMKRLQRMNGWHDPLSDSLFAEIERLDRELERASQSGGGWNALTDEDRKAAFESLPDMLEGFLKKWGWLHFAKEIERRCYEKNQGSQPGGGEAEDAARYRFIRDVPYTPEVHHTMSLQLNATMDEVIDAARASLDGRKL